LRHSYFYKLIIINIWRFRKKQIADESAQSREPPESRLWRACPRMPRKGIRVVWESRTVRFRSGASTSTVAPVDVAQPSRQLTPCTRMPAHWHTWTRPQGAKPLTYGSRHTCLRIAADVTLAGITPMNADLLCQVCTGAAQARCRRGLRRWRCE
jgi:hypothetical protein